MTITAKPMKRIRPALDAKVPKTAMILCAGLGTRMAPLTDDKPKAMVRVGGQAMIDRALKRCRQAGVERAVINLHAHADVLETHLAKRAARLKMQKKKGPRIVFSDERAQVLDTGGGVKHALPLLGSKRFFVINCDVVWQDGLSPGLVHLAHHWNSKEMDVLCLLVPMVNAVGIGNRGDFTLDPDGTLRWRAERKASAFAYSGIQIVHPRAFDGAHGGAFSMRDIWNTAMHKGRAFGCVHEGRWAHVGTPDAIGAAERALYLGKGAKRRIKTP